MASTALRHTVITHNARMRGTNKIAALPHPRLMSQH
jgi:hypothetical protein